MKDPALETLVGWIRTHAAKAAGLLVPVSGGSDSALGFWACMQAFPDKTMAIHAGSPETLRRREWFTSVGPVEFISVPGDYVEREEIRWARFLASSLKRRAWLVGCRNRTEDVLGTYSLASRVTTFLPLARTWKSQVMRLAATVGVPEEIMASSARADPDCGRPAELAEIPFGQLDDYLRMRAGLQAWHPLTGAQGRYLESVITRNAFKRTLPILGPET